MNSNEFEVTDSVLMCKIHDYGLCSMTYITPKLALSSFAGANEMVAPRTNNVCARSSAFVRTYVSEGYILKH